MSISDKNRKNILAFRDYIREKNNSAQPLPFPFEADVVYETEFDCSEKKNVSCRIYCEVDYYVVDIIDYEKFSTDHYYTKYSAAYQKITHRKKTPNVLTIEGVGQDEMGPRKRGKYTVTFTIPRIELNPLPEQA